MRTRLNPALWLGIALIIITGVVHFVDTSDAFSETTYKGLLFLANGFGALFAAGAILTGRRWGWGLGTLVAASAFIGYILSRTVGMPGLPSEPDAWLEPLGVVSLVAEGLFVILAARMLTTTAAADTTSPARSAAQFQR
jgi:hypothetical protein